MASSLALKRLVSSNMLPISIRMIRPMAVAPSTSRLFNTNAMREFESDGEDRDVCGERHHIRSLSRLGDDGFLSDVFDPFSPYPRRSLSMGMGRRSWDAKHTEDALTLRIDMPGLGKEDVNVCAEHNTVIIKGEGDKQSEDDDDDGRYTCRIQLPDKIYKIDQIKAEMKNGVLKVIVPKIKDEERHDVIQVQVA